MACPFARSRFNLALKGEYDFLDGAWSITGMMDKKKLL
jgi:hypothetical protein